MNAFKKARIYIQAAFIAVGRTIKENFEKMKKSFKENSTKRKQIEKQYMRRELPMDEKNIIKWTQEEVDAIRRLDEAHSKNEPIFMSETPREKYVDSLKFTPKDKQKEDDEPLFFSSPNSKDKFDNENEDDRDIG